MPLPVRAKAAHCWVFHPPPFYESSRQKPFMEHEDQTTVEEAVRNDGYYSVRELWDDVNAQLCPSTQTKIHNNDRTTLSHSDVRDDNRDHYTPSKFGVKLCQMWIDALKTDDEQWYLDGYNLYIDKVIFNPNI